MIDTKLYLNLLNPWYLLATGFGSGLSPIMPGTIGSLFAIPFWLLMDSFLPVWFCWLVILISFFGGIIICQRTSNHMRVHDHTSIVWDEFIGIWITLMGIPVVNWQSIFVAFILFRFFDTLKPWPIVFFDQKVKGGFGIMLDDLIAAIFVISSISFMYYFFNFNIV